MHIYVSYLLLYCIESCRIFTRQHLVFLTSFIFFIWGRHTTAADTFGPCLCASDVETEGYDRTLDVLTGNWNIG